MNEALNSIDQHKTANNYVSALKALKYPLIAKMKKKSSVKLTFYYFKHLLCIIDWQFTYIHVCE